MDEWWCFTDYPDLAWLLLKGDVPMGLLNSDLPTQNLFHGSINKLEIWIWLINKNKRIENHHPFFWSRLKIIWFVLCANVAWPDRVNSRLNCKLLASYLGPCAPFTCSSRLDLGGERQFSSISHRGSKYFHIPSEKLLFCHIYTNIIKRTDLYFCL